MKMIYSMYDPSLLLHSIYYRSDCDDSPPDSRIDISPREECLQVARTSSSKGTSFAKHRHLEQARNIMHTQECWIVIQGKIRIECYDIGDSLLLTEELSTGDMLVTFRGGHSYETLENGTVVYEVKQGPYNGIEKDKVRF